MRKPSEMISYYQDMKRRNVGSMYHEAKWQYQDMAKGGDGGGLGFERDGETTCRGINYKGYPDSFFQKVCEGMGWLPVNESARLEAYSSDPM